MLTVCKYIRRRISEEQEKLQRFNDLLNILSAPLDGLPHSDFPSSRVESLSISIIDAQTSINQLCTILNDCLTELAIFLNQHLDKNQANVLFARYGLCMHFRNIATSLGYSERRVYQIHGQALKNFSTISVALQSANVL